MAFESSSTLQQDDNVAAVAGSDGGTIGGGGAGSWGNLTDKPFTDIGDGLGVSSDALEVVPSDFAGDGLQVSSGDLAVESTVARTNETRLLARRLVQTQADLDALDSVTVRRAREVRVQGTQNQVSTSGRDGALDQDVDLTLSLPQDVDTAADTTFNSVTLGSQASSANKAVRADRSILGGEGIQDAGDLTSDPTVEVDSTVARTDRNETFNEDVKVIGSLTVEGEETIVNTTTLEAEDNLLFLNAGDTGAGVTKGQVGFEADRGTSPPINLIFDESDDLGRVGVKYRTLSYSSASGSFSVNETVVGSSSGAEGIVWADTGSKLRIKGRTGSFDLANDTLDGQSSGTTASLDSVSTVDMTQAIATRESGQDGPEDFGIPYYNPNGGDMGRFDTTTALTYEGAGSNAQYNGEEVQISAGIGHPDYTAELEHWYITPGGLGDFRTLLADELRVEAFIAEVEEALAGSDFLTKSFGTLDEPFDVPSSGAVGTQKDLTVQDLDGLGATPVFGNDTSEQDDTLRLRIVDRSGGGLTVADIWLRCIAGSYTDNGDGTQTWTVEILQAGDGGIGAGLTAPTGSVLLDYGVPGDFLIERSVLDPDSGDIAPYDRMLKWRDTTGDRIPDEFDVLNLRGRLDGLPKAYASGFGTYTETGRFTSDVAIGDLEAADQDSDTGSYLRYTESGGIKIVNSDGYQGAGDNSYSNAILQLEDDVRLLAENITQEKESRAGLELKANENSAKLTASVQYEQNGTVSNRAALELFAGPDGSSATIVGESIRLDGNTLVDGTFTVEGDTVTLDGNTTVNANFTVTGDTVTLNSNTTIDGSFELTDSNFAEDIGDTSNLSETSLSAQASENESNIKLVARRLTQERESRAGIELKTNENSAKIDLNASIIGDDSLFSQSSLSLFASKTQSRFKTDVEFNESSGTISLTANDNGVEGRFSADSITISGDTTFVNNGIPDSALSSDYTTESNVTISKSGNPNDRSNLKRPGGGDLQAGDIYIQTDNGDRPWSYDGKNWNRQYTSINGGNLETGSVTASEINTPDFYAQDATVQGVLSLTDTGGIQGGAAGSRFAFGNYTLDRQSKATVTHSSDDNGSTMGASVNIPANGIGSGNRQAVVTRSLSISTSAEWVGEVVVDYYVEISGGNPPPDSTGQATLKIEALDSNDNVLDSSTEKAFFGFGTGTSGTAGSISTTVPLVVSGTAASDLRITIEAFAESNESDTRAEASVGNDPDGEAGSGPISKVFSSKDFIGPQGGAWRKGGSLQVLINGRDSSGPKSTAAGDMWLSGTLTENSDLRDKSDVARASGLDVLRDIRGLTYTKDGRAEAGVGAQDLLNTFDRAVRGSEEEGYSVAYSALTAPVIEAIKELDDYTQDHEARIAALERENERLRSLIE